MRQSRTEVAGVPVIIAASAVHVPGMTATIGGIEVRASKIEVVAPRVAGIDAEMPEAGIPVERTVEVAGCTEGIPLP